MSNIFFTSDTHFGHDKSFLWSGRGFSSIEEHGEELVRRWNQVVGKNDIVYHLGDMMLSQQNEEQAIRWIKQLNGYIYWIFGNHDTDRRITEILTRCDNVVQDCGFADRMKLDGFNLYLSHYPTRTINSLDSDEMIKKTLVFNLHGHTHQTTNFSDELLFNNYHIGLDSHNLRPVCWDEIKQELQNLRQECINTK